MANPVFCGFCDLLGHKISQCARYELAQQQAELHQAEMDAHMAALQQQHEADTQYQEANAHDNMEAQPAMVQEGMEWTEDSLSSSSTSSLASVVTCTDFQRE
ncbi:uncharacterized protein LOC113357048 [Papaver somniferum]|uniref:uncharacterized protein LOC113357048 n=1 Tax=Papaver somniferum TaxID=3469 RepID=UPI000E6FA345|nr:uncharacterized protein LOC113357048 [Papaver somniferum]